MEQKLTNSDNSMKDSQKKKKKKTKKLKERNLTIRPYVLKGHERPISKVKFNEDGDLLFTGSRDKNVCLWYRDNGERIGTYTTPGAINDFDVTKDSDLLITGSGDGSVLLWRVETGEELYAWKIPGRVQSVRFNYGESQFLVAFNSSSTSPGKILIFPFNKKQPGVQKPVTIKEIQLKTTSGIKQTVWGYLNENILTVTDKGVIHIHNPESGEEIKEIQAHKNPINSIQFNKDQSFFITTSDDLTAKLFDSQTFQHLKTYETSHPVNAVAFSPILDQIIIGGGQHAAGTALMGTDLSQFATKFYHLIDESELASVKGHFGPINSLDFSRDGKSFVSGGEEGIVRLHHLTEDYVDGALEEIADEELSAQFLRLW